jgi:acyl carrier protein
MTGATDNSARRATLCALFADVFGVPEIGPDDDFFELGGRSVEAVLLAGRISATFGVAVSIADVFNAPTVAQLDQRIDFGAVAVHPATSDREDRHR